MASHLTQDFVQILDPATGTGTFLVEAIALIHKTLVAKWKAQGHGKTKIARTLERVRARSICCRACTATNS